VFLFEAWLAMRHGEGKGAADSASEMGCLGQRLEGRGGRAAAPCVVR
jgi:hypothetical protein